MDAAFTANRTFTLVFFLAFFLQACAPSSIEKLPDDPANEPAPITREDEGAKEHFDEPPMAETPPMTELPPVTEEPPTVQLPQDPTVPETYEERVLRLYDHLDPERVVPTQALKEAVLYFHENKSKFTNQKVLSILDFNQSSVKKRWHFVYLGTGEVWSLHVSHGKGSDSNHDGYAEKFSNVSGSNATSLGFYRTAETYTGSNGYSLRLDGLSSTNSKARARAIVVHGASYVQDRNVIQGRSWGCPAVSMTHHRKVIDLIKGGSLIYAVGGEPQAQLLGQL